MTKYYRTRLQVLDNLGFERHQSIANLSKFPKAGDVVDAGGRTFEVLHTALKATRAPMNIAPASDTALPALLVREVSGQQASVVEVSGGSHAPPCQTRLIVAGSNVGEYYVTRPVLPGDGVDIEFRGTMHGHRACTGPHGLYLEANTLEVRYEESSRRYVL